MKNISHRVICEVYVNGNISNISKSISDFVKMSDFLLRLGVETFYIYSSTEEFVVFRDILNLYTCFYPELRVVKRSDKVQLSRKANFIIIFNWEEDIIVYDKEFNKIKLSNDYGNKHVFNNEPLEVDLMY